MICCQSLTFCSLVEQQGTAARDSALSQHTCQSLCRLHCEHVSSHLGSEYMNVYCGVSQVVKSMTNWVHPSWNGRFPDSSLPCVETLFMIRLVLTSVSGREKCLMWFLQPLVQFLSLWARFDLFCRPSCFVSLAEKTLQDKVSGQG